MCRVVNHLAAESETEFEWEFILDARKRAFSKPTDRLKRVQSASSFIENGFIGISGVAGFLDLGLGSLAALG